MIHLATIKNIKVLLSSHSPDNKILTIKNSVRYLDFNKSLLLWCCKNFIQNYGVPKKSFLYVYIRQNNCYEIWSDGIN